jgi:Skp family chaperone for outer membrane proteins
MNWIFRKSKQIVLCGIIISSMVTSLQAQTIIAYMYRDSILAVTPGYIPAIKKVDSLKTVYNNEVQTANQQWQGKMNSLLTPYNPTKEETFDAIKKRMNGTDTTQLSLLIKENVFITEKTKTYNQLYQQAFAKEVQAILNKVDAIVSKYAVANKIDFVYMMEELERSIAYINKKKNITQAIIKEVVKLGK